MNVKLFANKALFELKKKSPALAIGGGIILSVGAMVMACKNTPKAEQLLDESRKQIKDIHTIADDPANGYTVEDKNKAVGMVWLNFFGGLIKLYGLPAAMEIAAILLFIWSHGQMSARVAGLNAVILGLNESLRRSQENVAERFGEEKANDIYYGLETQKVEETVLDEETGKEKKVKVTAKVVNEDKIVSPYAVFFDDSNPNYQYGDPIHNTDFIGDAQLSMTRRRNNQGYLFLNEARQALGFKMTPEGQVMGWGPDDTIDFGIDHIGKQEVRDFRNGFEKVFIIDFPGIRPIIDDISQLDKSNRAF